MPGPQAALAYLESLRTSDTEILNDALEDDEVDALEDIPHASPDDVTLKHGVRHGPDELLDAIAIMRICCAAEGAEGDLLRPGPGLLSVLVVPSIKDRSGVARRHPDLWRRLSAQTRVVRHAGAITFQLAEVAVTGPMLRAILAAIC
jgi:hypothetical protein